MLVPKALSVAIKLGTGGGAHQPTLNRMSVIRSLALEFVGTRVDRYQCHTHVIKIMILPENPQKPCFEAGEPRDISRIDAQTSSIFTAVG